MLQQKTIAIGKISQFCFIPGTFISPWAPLAIVGLGFSDFFTGDEVYSTILYKKLLGLGLLLQFRKKFLRVS